MQQPSQYGQYGQPSQYGRYGRYGAGSGAPYGPPQGPVPGGGACGPLAPGARAAGTLICVILLGVEIAWAVRDIRAIGFHGTLWTWLGLRLPGLENGFIATTGIDVVLVVVLLGGLAAARRSSAGWAFLAVGVFTVGYRLCGLWIFTADWAEGAPLHDRALTTDIVFVAGGLALILIHLAGRRPPGPVAPSGPVDYGTAGPLTGPDAPAAAPRTGPAIAGGLLAIALGLELAGWQLYDVQKYNNPGYQQHLYKHLLTGEQTLSSLLGAPEAYSAWITVVIALALAVTAFAKSPAARPLGLALGFTMFLNGVIGLDTWHTEQVLFTSTRLPTYILAQQSFEVFELIAGLLLITLLGLRSSRLPATSQPDPTWAPPPPSPYATPATRPSPPPPVPPGGAFGPPPNLPPDLPPQDYYLPPPPPQYPPQG